jgi:hypothetical protein
MAFRTLNIIGRPPARVTKPASIAKIATASRIEVSFLRVEIESGVNENSIVGPIATIFGQEKGTRPSQFWDPDVWDVCAFIRHSPDARRDEGDGRPLAFSWQQNLSVTRPDDGRSVARWP